MATERKEDSRHTEALERFKLVCTAEHDQRLRELEDAKFARGYEPGDQWPEDALQMRGTFSENGEVWTPTLPTITINKVAQPVEQVCAQYRNAKVALTVQAKTEGATDDTAEVLEGLVRQIQTDSNAIAVRGWALETASKRGRGFYEIRKEYAKTVSTEADIAKDPTLMDQNLVICRILDQASVFFDPFAQNPDNSDANWCFKTTDLPLETYRRLYGDSEVAQLGDHELAALGNSMPKWFGQTKEKTRTVRVAEYYYKTFTTRTLVIQKDGGAAWLDALGWKENDPRIARRRHVEIANVEWMVLNGQETLDEEDCQVEYIPIITTIGKEEYIDGEHSFSGIPRDARGACQMYNFEVSTLATTVSLASKAPYIGYKESFEGLDDFWAQANSRNWSYLPVNRRPLNGMTTEDLPFPQRNIAEPPIQAISQTIAQFDQDIKATLGFFDPNLHSVSAQGRSGKAVLALQNQATSGQSRYVENLSAIAMPYEGKVLLSWIPKVYDRPGRVIRTIGYDNRPREVMINQPHVMQDGKPTPVPPGQQANDAKHYDLTKGQYTCVISAGRDYPTMKAQSGSQIGDLMQAVPALIPVVGDIWARNQDGPGMPEVARRLEKALDPKFKEDDGKPQIPPEVQQEMAKGQHMIDELTKHVEDLTQQVQTQQAKAQGTIAVTQIKADADVQKARMDNETKIAVAELGAKVDRLTLFLEERARIGVQDHDTRMAMADAGHDEHMASLAANNAAALSAQGHGQMLEQGQQAAALTPPPPEPGAGA